MSDLSKKVSQAIRIMKIAEDEAKRHDGSTVTVNTLGMGGGKYTQ